MVLKDSLRNKLKVGFCLAVITLFASADDAPGGESVVNKFAGNV